MKNRSLLLALCIIITTPVFAQNPDMSLIPYRQGDLWGYASPGKKIVIAPVYNEAGLFFHGFASVKKGAKYGYINTAGKLVIPFKFYVAKPFRLGYLAKGDKIITADDLDNNQRSVLFAAVSLRTDGYEICINTKGEAMSGCPAIPENSAPELNKPQFTAIEKNYSTIQKTDLFDKITDDYNIRGSEDSYYIAGRGNNYGVFNNKFEVVVPFEYQAIKKWDINNSVYLEVQKSEGKGLLNANGTVAIAADNSNLTGVKAADGNYYFIVSRNGKMGIKDVGGNDIAPLNYADIIYEPAGGFILTGTNNLKGFRFLNNFILEPKYAEVRFVRGGQYVMVTSQTGRSGYINDKGQEFFVE